MTQLNPVPSRDSVLGTDKSTENVIFEQIREHDRVFRDVRPPPHQVRRVVFDNELSAVGDLTRRITVLLTTANPACPEYRWRIPHEPNKPPFAISVATSPCPLPYRLETVNDEVDVAHTEIVIDLSSCRPNTTHEFSFRYSQTAVVLAVRRRPFFTQWTWVWSYTFLSQSQYLLRPGGTWCFNLSRYLGTIKIGTTMYNDFEATYIASLSRVARRRGIKLPSVRVHESKQFADTDWETRCIEAAGLQVDRVEAWPLPLLPSQAYEFTIDGFYAHGSRVTFAPEIMKVPLDVRTGMLKDALAECKKALDTQQRPHIANFVATRRASR
jgi:hypothetical protein